ncbi:MAG: YkgJ family cysteine cluster protein [Desulfovibrionaceae bacterium]|nr:YkgJ family cysteine cluster protein [Desulfovibrionaceae bacterium]
MTLRAGELAVDNVLAANVPADGAQAEPAPLAREIVKIRGRDGRWTCHFYDAMRGCLLHGRHPAECRALACWDPSGLAAMYTQGRLTRRDLVHAGALVELMDEHDERCAVGRMAEQAAEALAVHVWREPGAPLPPGEAVDGLLEALRYDAALRSVIVERTGCTRAELDFLFGRPVAQVLRAFGLRTTRDADGAPVLTPDRDAR